MLKLLGLIFAIILIADFWVNDRQIIKASFSLLTNLVKKVKSLFTNVGGGE